MPLKVKKKPTRRELLAVVTELQRLIGSASAYHANDRNPNGFEQGQRLLSEAFQLCLDARSFDPPTDLPA